MIEESRANENFSLVSFLATEEQNLLTSTINLRDEFDSFWQLDQVFRDVLPHLGGNEVSRFICQMMIFVHYHLYFSTTTYLRGHKSEAYSSARVAIDATFHAYRFIKEPTSVSEYLASHKSFKRAKQ